MKKLENKFVNIDQSDIDIVVSALKAKELAGTANVVKEYETLLAEYFNCKYALACNSGTGGIELILRSLGISKDDEVILPPTAPVMCILPIIAIGATPVFVDIESNDSFNFSKEDLLNKISDKSKAILMVPMWGYPNDCNEIIELARSKNIPTIEDVSHCHGSKFNNSMMGTIADIGLFSTQERKMITTGEGGFILTNSEKYNYNIAKMRNFGRSPSNISYFDKKIEDFGVDFGMNFRINALGAALGITQLRKLEDKIKLRTQNAFYIKDRIKQIDWLQEIPICKDSRPNYYSLVLRVIDDNYSATEIGKYLEEAGIISDTFRYDYQPLYRMSAFSQFKSECPNAEILTKSIITLPTHEGLTIEDLDRIIKTIIDYASTK